MTMLIFKFAGADEFDVVVICLARRNLSKGQKAMALVGARHRQDAWTHLDTFSY